MACQPTRRPGRVPGRGGAPIASRIHQAGSRSGPFPSSVASTLAIRYPESRKVH